MTQAHRAPGGGTFAETVTYRQGETAKLSAAPEIEVVLDRVFD